MSDNTERKKLPFPEIKGDNAYLIVKYSEDGKLHLIQNTKNISCEFDDFLVATYTKTSETDTHLPYDVCQVVALVNQYTLEIADFLDVNIYEQEIDYYGEDAVLNITNPDGGNDGFKVVISGESRPAKEAEEDSLDDIMEKVANPVPKLPNPAKEFLDKKGEDFMFRKFIRK